MKTLESVLEGRPTVETAGEFPAVVDFQSAGAWVYGEYQGVRMFKNSKGEACKGHALALYEWNGVGFTKNKKSGHIPLPKEVVSVSGTVLDRGLDQVGIGQLVGIEFTGLGEKQGTRSAPRIFSVKVVRA